MAIIIAILGIALYYFAGRVEHVTLYAAGVVGLGFVFLVLATWIGASKPYLAAAAFRASALLPLALGAIMAASVILATAWVFSKTGSTPTPMVQALSAAALAVIALIAEKFGGMDRFRPSSVAASLTRWRYGKGFAHLDGTPSPAFKAAYEAIHYEATSDESGSIHGWGFNATCRRLIIIQHGM